MAQGKNGSSSQVSAGDVLGGKYRLERKLGQGAMGTVWSALHLTLGQRVAIKLISAEHAQSPEARARFSVEAKAAARLKSRHVVQVYDDGETAEGTPYIVMEYLEGETLDARLEREKGVHLVDAVRITGQVARALSRAHARGIVHRDLKPANIFLARNDEDELGWTAKVLDFGIAKIDEQRDKSTTKTGAVLGTPLFMSPEQVRGASSVDRRTDLYSLGLCFFNMLTGRYAFDGESFGDILVSICTEPLPNLKAFAPSVPDSVASWFERCCAREPDRRFQSADELVEALQAAVGGAVLLVPRGAVPEDFRGPGGTLRGHAAPLSPTTRALSTDDSGRFLLPGGADDSGGYQPLAAAPSVARAAQFSSSDGATSVLTVHDAPPALPMAPRRPLWLAGAAVLMIVLGVGVMAWRSARSESPGAAASATPAQDSAARVAAPAAAAPAATDTAAPVTQTSEPAAPAPVPAAPDVEHPKTAGPKRQVVAPAARKPAVAKPAAPTHRPPAKRRSTPADLGF